MSTTVTPATFTALTGPGAGGLSLIAICTLLILLAKKELVTEDDRDWTNRLDTALDVALAPLLAMFALIVVMRVYALFR